VFTETRLQQLGVQKMADRLSIINAMFIQQKKSMDNMEHPACHCCFFHRIKPCWLGTFATDAVSVPSIDQKMSTFSMVNLLLLIIPFNVVPYIGFAAWDTLLKQVDACNVTSFQPDPLSSESFSSLVYVQDNYTKMMQFTLLAIFSPLTTLLAIVVYFIFRPGLDAPEGLSANNLSQMLAAESDIITNKSFRRWWPCSGRLFALLVVGGTVIGVGSVVIYALTYIRNFITPASEAANFCKDVQTRQLSYDAAYLAVAFVALTILLFGF
jgi:hypothetical protein